MSERGGPEPRLAPVTRVARSTVASANSQTAHNLCAIKFCSLLLQILKFLIHFVYFFAKRKHVKFKFKILLPKYRNCFESLLLGSTFAPILALLVGLTCSEVCQPIDRPQHCVDPIGCHSYFYFENIN